MKKILPALLLAAALCSVAACSDADYDEKYPDPSKTATVGVPQVFTGVMFKGNTWMNHVYYRHYTQGTTSGVFAGIVGTTNNKGRFMGAGEGCFNTRWQNFYDMLTQYRLLEYTYNQLAEPEQKANVVFLLCARTMINAQLHEMLSVFGDVPYKGAGMLWSIGYDAAKSQCTYDDDVELYRQILADLKDTGDKLAAGVATKGFKAQDYTVAAGDPAVWRKYANSLRLRIALHLATGGELAAEAKTAIAEILNNPSQYPLIDSNDENMGVTADTQKDDFNFGKSTSQAMRDGNRAAGSQAVLDAMRVPATGVPDAGTDPRIDAMYDCNPDGAYIAFDAKMTDTQIKNLSDAKHSDYVARGMAEASYFCEVDTQAVAGWKEYQGNANLHAVWIGAAEVSLSKAEAYLMGYGVPADQAKAKQWFVKGVEQSCEYYWDLKQNSSLYTAGNDSYRGFRPSVRPTAADITAYANSIWQPTQEAVCTQLWLNFGYLNKLEAWNVVRRTGFPVVTFARDAQSTSYATPPGRLPYPSNERDYNTANCQAAIAANYKEDTGFYSTLFWAKERYYKLVGE